MLALELLGPPVLRRELARLREAGAGWRTCDAMAASRHLTGLSAESAADPAVRIDRVLTEAACRALVSSLSRSLEGHPARQAALQAAPIT